MCRSGQKCENCEGIVSNHGIVVVLLRKFCFDLKISVIFFYQMICKEVTQF